VAFLDVQDLQCCLLLLQAMVNSYIALPSQTKTQYRTYRRAPP